MDDVIPEDFETGKIHFRDKWQFELKSELYPFKDRIHFWEQEGNLVQEFYFFIPNSLQINDQTYPKAQFYQDQTNLIRLKTPRFSFKELIDPINSESPLYRIKVALTRREDPEAIPTIQRELKLFGSIFHTSLRNWYFHVIQAKAADSLDDLERLLLTFRTLQRSALSQTQLYFRYVDEFVSLTLNDYLCDLLEKIDQKSLYQRICNLLLSEEQYRKEHFPNEIPAGLKSENLDEYILYRKGLLNKFVIDPLLLKTSRSAVDQRFRFLIGGIPAAIAMLLFLSLYVWQGSWFIINSEPFILFTVLIYVLKDRLKEELRFFSYRQVAKWFADYTTKIRTPNDDDIGNLQEYVSFIEESKIPQDISEIRNRHFHQVLEEVKRPEQVIYYKKSILIKQKTEALESRFYGLNIFFRFDIHHFLAKAEDPYQNAVWLNETTLQLIKKQVPRVYHLNIIVKSRIFLPDGTPKEELMKYRLVLNKNGIERIEQI